MGVAYKWRRDGDALAATDQTNKMRYSIAQFVLSFATLAISITALVGYITGEQMLFAPITTLSGYNIGTTGMAPNTAICILCLSLIALLQSLKEIKRGK